MTSLPSLKMVARMDYGESLAQEARTDGRVPVFGSNGVTGVHDKANTLGPAIIVGRKGSFGKLTWTDVPGFCIDTAYYIDERHTTANLRWLFWALQTLGLDVHSEDTGVPGLSREKAYQCKLPTTPLHEQTRIANFLDAQTSRIDLLIAEKLALIESLRLYLMSYLSHRMTSAASAAVKMVKTSFPELGSLPAHWTVERLKFLGTVRSGITKGKDVTEKQTVTLPYLRVANVQDGYVDLAELSEIEVSVEDATRCLLRRGDVLMNEGGDNDKLGRGTVWQAEVEPCLHQNHVFAVRLHDLEMAEWVSLFTSTAAARTYFFLRSKQSTNLASINQADVRELPVPMPPQAERHAILSDLRRVQGAVNDLAEHAQAHIERLREYRSSLISAAVTGQLDIGEFKEAA